MIMEMRGLKRGYEHDVGANFNFNFHKSPLPPILFRSGPPVSAIDRFLLGHNNNSSSNSVSILPLQKTQKNTTMPYASSSLLSSKMDVNKNVVMSACSNGNGLAWQTAMQEVSFVNGLFGDGEGEGEGETSQDGASRNTNELGGVNGGKRPSKKRKGKGSSPLIKGQWTVQEDRFGSLFFFFSLFLVV